MVNNWKEEQFLQIPEDGQYKTYLRGSKRCISFNECVAIAHIVMNACDNSDLRKMDRKPDLLTLYEAPMEWMFHMLDYAFKKHVHCLIMTLALTIR